MMIVEILRRLIALTCVLLAAWAAVYYIPRVVQVHPIIVTAEQAMLEGREQDMRRLMTPMVGADRLRGITLHPEAKLAPAAFLAQMTKGCPVVTISGNAATTFVDGVFATADCRPPTDAWRLHYGSSSLPDYLYFLATDPRVETLVSQPQIWQVFSATDPRVMTQLPKLSFDHPVGYLRLGEGVAARYLRVTLEHACDGVQNASPLLVCPYRPYVPWLLLAAVLTYVLLPWPRRTGAVLQYRRGNAVIAPDWLGIVLTAFFFALAMLVVSRDSNFMTVMDVHGWAPLTAWSLLALLIGVPMLVGTVANTVFAITLLPDGFQLEQWGRVRHCRYGDITEADLRETSAPRFLKILGLLSLFLNPMRGFVPYLLLSRSYTMLHVHFTDGSAIRIPFEYLTGSSWLLREMTDAGVPVSADIRQTLTEMQEIGFPPRPSLQPRPIWTALVICLLLCAITAAAWLPAPGHQLFTALPKVPHRPITDAEIQEHHRIVVQMEQTSKEVDAAFARYRTATGQQKDTAYDAYLKAMDRFTTLSSRADALEKRMFQ